MAIRRHERVPEKVYHVSPVDQVYRSNQIIEFEEFWNISSNSLGRLRVDIDLDSCCDVNNNVKSQIEARFQTEKMNSGCCQLSDTLEFQLYILTM